VSPPPLALAPADVAAIAPFVLEAGAGALAYWRHRQAGLASTPEAAPFQQAYRLHALHGSIQEQRLPEAFARLRAAGLEPLLGKGWAAARLYPERGLRPYGDIDLFVPATRHAEAVAALRGAAPALPVDLHRGFADLDDRDPEAIFSRSRTVELGGVPVRMFGSEDHLRLLALHALRHGVTRPLWLSDVAALVEAEGQALDWDYLLRGSPRRTKAVLCAIVLAGRLLGARLDGTPAAVSVRALPRWLEPAVLRQWGAGEALRTPLAGFLRRPSGVLRELRRHWPNPVEGTIGVGAPFNELPRLPFQIAHALLRGVLFAASLPRAVRQAWAPRGAVGSR
jgi:hypothetical protein